jgi:hypothetical protein
MMSGAARSVNMITPLASRTAEFQCLRCSRGPTINDGEAPLKGQQALNGLDTGTASHTCSMNKIQQVRCVSLALC